MFYYNYLIIIRFIRQLLENVFFAGQDGFDGGVEWLPSSPLSLSLYVPLVCASLTFQR